MFGLTACTGSLFLIGGLAVVAMFLALIVGLGYVRLLRESGKLSVWTLATSMPLFRRGYFGERLEIPRQRIVTIFVVFALILSIVVLCSFARAATC